MVLLVSGAQLGWLEGPRAGGAPLWVGELDFSHHTLGPKRPKSKTATSPNSEAPSWPSSLLLPSVCLSSVQASPDAGTGVRPS